MLSKVLPPWRAVGHNECNAIKDNAAHPGNLDPKGNFEWTLKGNFEVNISKRRRFGQCSMMKDSMISANNSRSDHVNQVAKSPITSRNDFNYFFKPCKPPILRRYFSCSCHHIESYKHLSSGIRDINEINYSNSWNNEPKSPDSFQTVTYVSKSSNKEPNDSVSCSGSSSDVTVEQWTSVLRLDHHKGPSSDNKHAYPLRLSLFPNVPPYLAFNSCKEMAKLPKEIRKRLFWRSSCLLPNIIKSIVVNSGFSISEEDAKCVSIWEKFVNCQRFGELGENQKINHFPGTFHLGRKDKLWLNIVRMQERNGKDKFSFMPQTFVLPQNMKEFREAWFETGNKSKWIIKPPAAARGLGISIVNRWSDIPKTEDVVIIQRYISQPFLINETKFDLRLYTLVTSFDPLRIYVYEDGLVRFASEKYSTSCKRLGESYVHLTNYSINRSNSSYVTNEDENVRQGHKWSLKCLWAYFRENNIDHQKIWFSLIDVVVKTLISCEDPVSKLVKSNAKNRHSCYELFGFDIMLDHTLKPWLLEVNVSPSLHTTSHLDLKIKSELVCDVFNTVGFHIPNGVKLSTSSRFELNRRINLPVLSSIGWNKNLYHFELTHEDRRKQRKFKNCASNQQSILKKLTPGDVKMLVQSEDELARCGRFVRVFPSKTTSSYLVFFENPKYYNLLLDAWERKYHNDRGKGILLLQQICERKIHLIPVDEVDDKEQKCEESTISKDPTGLLYLQRRFASLYSQNNPSTRQEINNVNSETPL